jgi:hypothetical protein
MAGHGNPYAVLSDSRKLILFALHNDAFEAIQNPQSETELKPLVEASLVKQRADKTYSPTFFIADAQEVKWVNHQARATGHQLAARVKKSWRTLQTAFAKMPISQKFSFAEQAFFLVGDCILDVGLLNALARAGNLLTPAPARPSPNFPDAHYCFWMIEGDADSLGCYGQRYSPLPWNHWTLLTFGRYRTKGQPITSRSKLEQHIQQLAPTVPNATALGRRAALATYNRQAVMLWEQITRPLCDDLVQVYNHEQTYLKTLFTSCRSSKYAPESFLDFFCWYDHLAYAHAIDELITTGFLELPQSGFTTALWYEISKFAAF